MGRIIKQTIKLSIAFKLFFVSNFLFGQISIEGVVLNKLKDPIEQVSVLLYSNEKLIEYTFTKADGSYKFKVKSNTNYIVKLTSMVYESKTALVEVKNESKKYNFILNDKNTTLKEVVLNVSKDIEIRKDTIIFKAAAFKTKRQIVLEDLLKDIPGIQISDNGSITFQGKLVTNVKIENDDLFNGGYKIITKNLKADLVDKVQLLKNYSENPLLKGVKDTEDIGINITLKEDRKATLFGDVDVLTNLNNRHHLNANLISFLKKAKHYGITNYNNIGENTYLDYQNIFSSKSDNLTYNIGNNQKSIVYTTLNTQRPSFKDEYVNINNSKLYNFNSIFNINSKIKLKTIFLDYNDQKDFQSNQQTIYITEPVIEVNEGSKIKQKEDFTLFKANLKWQIDKKSLLEYDGYYNGFLLKGDSDIVLPNTVLEENVNGTGKKTNHFINYTRKTKDSTVIQITGRYIYDKIPQDYLVTPFPYTTTFGEDYDIVKNETTNKLNYFIVQLSYFKNFKKNNIESYLGFHNRKELLNTGVSFRDSLTQEFNFGNSSFFNETNQDQSLLYLRNRLRRKLKKLSIALNLDLNLEKNNIDEDVTDFVYLNTNFHMKYTPEKKHEINIKSGVNQYNNTLNNLHEGFIPVNYRYYKKGLSSNQLQEYYSINANYIYGNWTDKFTGQASVNYNYGKKYLSFDSEIGTEITRAKKIILKGKNTFNSAINADRYLPFIKSNLKLKASYLYNEYENIVNNNNRKLTNNTFDYGFEVRSNFLSFFDYNLGFNWNRNVLDVDNTQTSIVNKNGFVDFDFYFNKIFFNFMNDFYFFDKKSDAQDYLFSNLRVNYKLNSKLTFQLKANNFFDYKSFNIFSQTDVSQSTFQTKLIGFYLILGVKYKF